MSVKGHKRKLVKGLGNLGEFRKQENEPLSCSKTASPWSQWKGKATGKQQVN